MSSSDFLWAVVDSGAEPLTGDDVYRRMSGGPSGGGGGEPMTVTGMLWRGGVILGLVLLAMTFTGLNIGLFAMDCGQLQVLIDVPKSDATANVKALQDAKYAKTILPLRRQGNLLLCTILLSNTMVNTGMAVLMSSFTSGFMGWLITTLLIVYIGEILPQSLCTRYGLMLGAWGAPIIWLAVCICFPIAKLYAIVLDVLFPDKESVMDRTGWREMLETMRRLKPDHMPEDQSQLLLGSLGLATNCVGDVMVPMPRCFHISLDDELSFEMVLRIQKSGFTRVPIYDSDAKRFAGHLHCKDLLRTDLGVDCHRGKALPVLKLLEALERNGQRKELFEVSQSMSLLDLLQEFKRGRPHLAVVCNQWPPSDDEGMERHAGLVTLHDVFAKMVEQKKLLGGGETPASCDGVESAFLEKDNPLRLQVHSGAIGLLNGHSIGIEDGTLSEPESLAVLAFLQATQACFQFEHLNEEEQLGLVRGIVAKRFPKGSQLYKQASRSNGAMLILQGKVEVKSGNEGIMSQVGSWACLGFRNLEPPMSLLNALKSSRGAELLEHHDAHDYIPDFTAHVVSSSSRILCIERKAYLQAYRHTQLQKLGGTKAPQRKVSKGRSMLELSTNTLVKKMSVAEATKRSSG